MEELENDDACDPTVTLLFATQFKAYKAFILVSKTHVHEVLV